MHREPVIHSLPWIRHCMNNTGLFAVCLPEILNFKSDRLIISRNSQGALISIINLRHFLPVLCAILYKRGLLFFSSRNQFSSIESEPLLWRTPTSQDRFDRPQLLDYPGQIFLVEISVWPVVDESNTKFARQVAGCICVIGSEINYPSSLKLHDNATLTDHGVSRGK